MKKYKVKNKRKEVDKHSAKFEWVRQYWKDAVLKSLAILLHSFLNDCCRKLFSIISPLFEMQKQISRNCLAEMPQRIH